MRPETATPLESRPSADVALAGLDIPLFLFPIFEAAQDRYGVPWQVLAAINDVETDFGRNATVSTAGARGWMQFMPSTWLAYGLDADGDGLRDPADPVDAIFSAAQYLQAAGIDRDLRAAVYAYNHANWYVDMVVQRAARLAALGEDTVRTLGRLTRLDPPTLGAPRPASSIASESVVLRTGRRAPVAAVAEGVVVERGVNRRHGRHLILRLPGGERVVYARLGRLAKYHLVPDAWPGVGGREDGGNKGKERLFAHPGRLHARRAGSGRQLERLGVLPLGSYFARHRPARRGGLRAQPLMRGARVLPGTVLGQAKGTRLEYAIRPAGRGAPAVDPRPFLQAGMRLRRSGWLGGAVAAADDGAFETGVRRWAELDQDRLATALLTDERIRIYTCGRADLARHAIDRRWRVLLLALADSGLHRTGCWCECGHWYWSASCNPS